MGWSGGWLRLEGRILGAPTAVSRRSDITDTFARGTDDRLWQNTWDRDHWTGWVPHNDGFILDSSPVADSMGPDHVHLFARGRDGEIYQKWWTFAKGWQTDLNTVDVGRCLMRQAPTDDQDRLFNNRNNVGSNDIVVYFVRTIPGFAGCAAHPEGKPGAVVASYAPEWVLAHELGHVLGLPHAEGPRNEDCPSNWTPPNTGLCLTDRVMTCCGVVTNPPPNLKGTEMSTVLSSPYIIYV